MPSSYSDEPTYTYRVSPGSMQPSFRQGLWLCVSHSKRHHPFPPLALIVELKMAENPTIEEIVSAIRDSGYLMEQEIASFFENKGFHVNTNVAFEDQDEKKSREIDVRSIKRVALNESEKMAAYVEILAECKNSSNPFVFIARPKNIVDKNRAPGEFVFPFEYGMIKHLDKQTVQTRKVTAFRHLGFDRVYNIHKNSWKAVQFCRVDRKGGGWHANHGGLYDAIFYPMAKAFRWRKNDIVLTNKSTSRHIWMLLPLVVTSGSLYLIDSSADQPAPELVDYVAFEREIKAGKLDGRFTVIFVSQQALEKFFSDVITPLAEHARQVIDEQSEFMRSTEIPWEEPD